MFLGYSEEDENLLRSHNNQTVLDAVNSLDSFMREEAKNQVILGHPGERSLANTVFLIY